MKVCMRIPSSSFLFSQQTSYRRPCSCGLLRGPWPSPGETAVSASQADLLLLVRSVALGRAHRLHHGARWPSLFSEPHPPNPGEPWGSLTSQAFLPALASAGDAQRVLTAARLMSVLFTAVSLDSRTGPAPWQGLNKHMLN